MSKCDVILDHGIFDELGISSVEKYQQTISSLASVRSTHDILQLNQTRESAQIVASIMGAAEGGGAWQRDAFSQRFEQIKQDLSDKTYANLQSEKSLVILRKTINESIVSAWLQCLKDDESPFRVFYTRNAEQQICLRFRYVPKRAQDGDSVDISDVVLDNLAETEADGTPFRHGTQLRKFQTYLWKLKLKDDELNATVEFSLLPNGEDFIFRIPGRPRKLAAIVPSQREKYNIWKTRTDFRTGRLLMTRELTAGGDIAVYATHENGQRELFHYVPTPAGYRVSENCRASLCQGDKHFSEITAVVLQGESGNGGRVYLPGSSGSLGGVRGGLVETWTAWEGPPEGGAMDDLDAFIPGYQVEYERQDIEKTL